MDITFNNKKLAKIVNDDRKLEQKMGKVRAEKSDFV
jgi:hypothetical protein